MKMDPQNRHKIRIAYVLATEVRAGVEEHVLSLLAHLNRDRFQPFLVAPPCLVEAFGEDLSELDVTTLPLRVGGLADIKGRVCFWRFLRKHKIDIVNTHMFLASFRFTPLAVLARVPVRLETCHLIEKWRLEKGWIKRNSFFIDRWFSKMQTAILAVSHACKRELISIKGSRPENIVVIQNGRGLDMFDPRRSGDARQRLRKLYGFSDDELVFGVMARLELQKGHEYLLEAVAKIVDRRQDFRILLVGEGARREELQSMATRLGIANRVVFAGFQSDVVGHYVAMDVMVLPSLYEGLPLCVIEAMAMEKPVIATEVDGTPEVVRHKVNGMLVPSRNAGALSEAIEYTLDHRAEVLAMGREGRKWVTEKFSLARQVKETEELYERLAAASRIGDVD
jgi:glycosyltransferase involved in cell wall biosynthesis